MHDIAHVQMYRHLAPVWKQTIVLFNEAGVNSSVRRNLVSCIVIRPRCGEAHIVLSLPPAYFFPELLPFELFKRVVRWFKQYLFR